MYDVDQLKFTPAGRRRSAGTESMSLQLAFAHFLLISLPPPHQDSHCGEQLLCLISQTLHYFFVCKLCAAHQRNMSQPIFPLKEGESYTFPRVIKLGRNPKNPTPYDAYCNPACSNNCVLMFGVFSDQLTDFLMRIFL